MTTYAHGYDISALQSDNFSWQAIVDAGISFIIARNGIGSNQLDGLYSKNVIGAKSMNLAFGCYNVIYPLNNDNPAAEAQYHYKASEGMPSFVDLEFPTVPMWPSYKITANSIYQWTLAYMQEYEALSGVRPILYSYPNFFEALALPQSFADTYKLWIASYTQVPLIPKPFSDYVVWQTAGGNTARLSNGLEVDTDVCKDLSIFQVPTTATQTPTPSVPVVNTTPQPDNTGTVSQPVITATASSTTPSTVNTSVQPIDITATASGTVAPIQATGAANPALGSPSVIQDIENLSSPGILSAIGTFISNLLKLLFSIK